MFYQKENQMGFIDGYVERRIHKNIFFKQCHFTLKWLKPCLENQDAALAITSCYADKGYQVPDNVTLLQITVKNHRVKTVFNTKHIETNH